ncbi:MAG: tetratricopeptide repeat protein [Terriglobales bacterium]
MPSPEKNENRAGLSLSPERQTLILGLLLVVATLALYNPVSHHPFVNYDDDRYVGDNAHVKAGLHWDTVRWAFTTYDEANWHPLTWLSHALDCQFFGLNPAGHHYTNVLLHALNVWLLFMVLKRATGSVWRSCMVGALFALHPINVESVAWVAERKNLISMLFFLLALGAYRWHAIKPRIGAYLLVAFLFACGLMSKPQVISLPFILLLWDYWPLRRAKEFFWLALEKLPLLAISAASAVITMKAQRAGNAVSTLVKYPLTVRLENAIVSYARYVGKAFWPAGLAPMYPHPGDSLKSWQVFAALLLLLTISAVVMVARRRRYPLVGWFWFLGTLVPMIGLVQVGSQAMADRYAYLTFVGLFIVVVWSAADGAMSWRIPNTALAGVSMLVLFGLAFVAHRQIGYWSDDVTLWSHTLQVTSNNFIAEDSLGGALLAEGQLEEAQPHFRAAAAIHPSDPLSSLNIAFYEMQHNDLPAAIQQFNKTIDLTPDARLKASAFTSLGSIYSRIGDLPHARESFEAAVALRPRTIRAWMGLGLAAYRSKDFAAAIVAFSKANAIQPSDVVCLLLARALEQSGRKDEAQAATEEAKRLSQDFDQAQLIANSLLAP